MNKLKTHIVLFLLIVIFSNNNIFSQNNDSTNFDISKYSLQDLMNMQVAVASQQSVSLNESPGIITVITDQEIKNSGAKDLISVLKLIPSIDFGTEWDNIIGIGIRGNNATEGKFLLLVDGHTMNETNFGTFPFGNHILVDDIRKIEIIRGSGSVIYGGSAELAVINIITKKGREIKGTNISTNYSFSKNNTSGYNLQSAFGNKFKNGIEYKISAGYSKANRSNELLNTLDTTQINYNDSSEIKSVNLKANLSYKGLNTQFMFDNYLSRNIESTGSILFKGFYFSTDYEININDKISIKPKFNWKNHKPWYFVDNTDKEIYNTTNTRHTFSVPVIYNSHKKVNFIVGSEIYWDVSKKDIDSIFFSSNNEKKIHYQNLAFYSEAVGKFKIFNLTLGGRYDVHNIYGGSFVPRLVLTKAFEKDYFKVLYSWAFKSPTISNIDYNQNIKSERTQIFELEIGHQFSESMGLYFNLFDIYIKNPILYIPNPVTGADYYTNFPQTGSRGAECEYRINKKRWYLTFAYAYYQKAYNQIPQYEIANKSKTYGAFPTSKLTMNSNFSITKKLDINSSFAFYGNRYTYIHSDKNWTNAELVKYKPSIVLNLYIKYLNLFTEGLDFSFGISDLTNTKYQYINAYSGWQNQIPDMGRELSLKISYDISAKN